MTAATPVPLPELDQVRDVDVVQLYQGTDGWRWRYCVAGVGKVEILADGGQGYEHRADAIAGAARVVNVRTALLKRSATIGDNGRLHVRLQEVLA